MNDGPDAPDTGFEHVAVLRERVVELLAQVPLVDGPAGARRLIVDATVGGGGHTRALLDSGDEVTVLGLDRDPDALAAAAEALPERFARRVELVHCRFDALGQELDRRGIPAVSGVLFDLGVSSPQFDRAERGFSYRHDGPLDMRMDQSSPGPTAADIVNGYEADRLATVLARYGDERFARRIAAAIVAHRPVTTTGQLADIVRDAIPAPARRRGGHPAKRTFQALRIECNQELDQLGAALDQAIGRLTEGGRCVVLSYHSGEDRIVKRRFVDASTGGCQCPPQLPCRCGAVPSVRLVKRGTERAGDPEVARNRRASSVRLRCCEAINRGAAPNPEGAA